MGTFLVSMGSTATDGVMSDSVDGFVATGGDNVKIICLTPPTLVL